MKRSEHTKGTSRFLVIFSKIKNINKAFKICMIILVKWYPHGASLYIE
ncbi:MAG: hypothetical protein ABH847_00405 [Candidatus Omnitrophota bacterium]